MIFFSFAVVMVVMAINDINNRIYWLDAIRYECMIHTLTMCYFF